MPRIWLEGMAEMQEICATLGHFRCYSEELPRCLHVCWLVVCLSEVSRHQRETVAN